MELDKNSCWCVVGLLQSFGACLFGPYFKPEHCKYRTHWLGLHPIRSTAAKIRKSDHPGKPSAKTPRYNSLPVSTLATNQTRGDYREVGWRLADALEPNHRQHWYGPSSLSLLTVDRQPTVRTTSHPEMAISHRQTWRREEAVGNYLKIRTKIFAIDNQLQLEVGLIFGSNCMRHSP